jgi:hypothetical protein
MAQNDDIFEKMEVNILPTAMSFCRMRSAGASGWKQGHGSISISTKKRAASTCGLAAGTNISLNV